MDINDVRIATTTLGLILFLGIAVWAWSRRRQGAFDEAAHLPFLDADAPTESAGEQR